MLSWPFASKNRDQKELLRSKAEESSGLSEMAAMTLRNSSKIVNDYGKILSIRERDTYHERGGLPRLYRTS